MNIFMDNFIPEWLEINNNLSKSEVSGNTKNENSDIKLDKATEFSNIHKKKTIVKEVNKDNQKPKSYNFSKKKKKNINSNLNKIEKKLETIKENPKMLDKQDEDYSYTDVCNFVDRFYLAPKIINNPEIYITSSEEELSDDLEDFNYN